MNLREAFILTCHTGYVSDSSFTTENKEPSKYYLEELGKLLKRVVYKEEFLVDVEKVLLEARTASYSEWMEIVNKAKD